MRSYGTFSRTLFALAALAIVLGAMKLAAALVLPIMLSIFVAVVTWPLIKSLTARGLPEGVATAIGIVVDVAVVGVLGMVLMTSLNSLYRRLPEYIKRFKSMSEELITWLAAHKVHVSAEDLQGVIEPGQLVGAAGAALGQLVGMLSNVALVLLVAAFFLLEARSMRDKLRALLKDRVDSDDDPINRAAHDIQKYLGVKTITSAVTGIVVGVWFWLLGVDFALLWGVLAFLLNFIPTIGSFIAVAPPILIALLMRGPGVALATATGSFLVNFTIGNIVEPRLFGRALKLSPVVVLLSMVLWGWLLGPIGAILSVPLTMIVRISASHSSELRWLGVMLSSGDDPLHPPVSEPPHERS